MDTSARAFGLRSMKAPLNAAVQNLPPDYIHVGLADAWTLWLIPDMMLLRKEKKTK